jgi:uncharacterized membrane-anchored protein YjiN (DUF445 family)
VKSVDDFLEHYGVKGMRWGTKKANREPASSESATSAAIRARAKTSSVKALSNKELQDAINRMNLEQQFKRLSTNERPVVTRFIASTLQEIGKREVQAQIAKKAAKLATKVA